MQARGQNGLTSFDTENTSASIDQRIVDKSIESSSNMTQTLNFKKIVRFDGIVLQKSRQSFFSL